MNNLRASSLLTITAAVIVALGACANNIQSAEDAPVEIHVSAPAALPSGYSLSGNYLSARFAQRQQDWHAAQQYMNAVIDLDTANGALEQRAFLLTVGAREYDRARQLAEKILTGQGDFELALIFLACDALTRNDFAATRNYMARLPDDGFGQYTKPLMTAWALAGEGKIDEALALLNENADENDPTYNIHVAMIAEMAGRTSVADKHYRDAVKTGLTLHTAVIAAQFFASNGDMETAEEIYAELADVYPVNGLGATLKPKANDPTVAITSPTQGAGLALFELSMLLYDRRAYDSAQIYGSMAAQMMPDSPFVLLLMGDLAGLNDRHGDAVNTYARVTAESPLFWLSRMRMAETFEVQENLPAARDLLAQLADGENTRIPALVALGDLHRRSENYAEAYAAYDAALNAIGEPTEEHWPIIYARGMSLERLDNWPRAEKDLLTALEFQPDNPLILNFIGYSWAEKGVNLEKALEFTHRAVSQRPDDGYILDSYAWTLYRLGRYEEALVWMEKAIIYVPDDSTVLDHLGDVYWLNGRRNEARFKWRRAHDISKDDNFRAAVEQKLHKGVAPLPKQVVNVDGKL